MATPASGADLRQAGAMARRGRRRPPLVARRLRRRWMVGIGKRLLPVVALALLASVALWPEFARQAERTRLAYRQEALAVQTGQMTQPVYHGVDDRGRPYTMTSAIATQV